GFLVICLGAQMTQSCVCIFEKFVCALFFFSSRIRHTRSKRDWSSDVCSSDLPKHSFTFQSPFGQIIAEPIFSNIDTLPAAIGLNKIHFHTSNESSGTPFIRGRQDPSAIRRPAVVLIAITV